LWKSIVLILWIDGVYQNGDAPAQGWCNPRQERCVRRVRRRTSFVQDAGEARERRVRLFQSGAGRLASRLQYPYRGADRRPDMTTDRIRSILTSLLSLLATIISVLAALSGAGFAAPGVGSPQNARNCAVA
jgi:hypothetical protein